MDNSEDKLAEPLAVELGKELEAFVWTKESVQNLREEDFKV